MPWTPNPTHTKAFEDVDALFKTISEMLGEAAIGRFFGDVPEGQAKVTWAQYLVGYSKIEIDRGLAELANRKFMPTLGEFSNWCRPSLDPEYAWYEADKCLRQRDDGKVGDWTHPAVWRAACRMSMEIRNGDFQRNRTRWTYELRWEMRKGFGEGVPVPAPRIESAPAKTGGPSFEVRSNIDRLMAEAKEHARKKRAGQRPADETSITGENDHG